MFKHLLSLILLTFAASTLTACATGNDGPRDPLEDEIADRGPSQCVRQDIGPMNSTIVSCVQDFGPSTLPEEMQMRNPHVVSVIETPGGSFGNPLTWSMEVRRDGELIIEREFGEDDAVVEEEEGRAEIRSAVPLNEEEQLVPGIYEFRYLQDEQGEVGTTTIEIEPPEEGEEGEDEDGEEADEEEQPPVQQAPQEQVPEEQVD